MEENIVKNEIEENVTVNSSVAVEKSTEEGERDLADEVFLDEIKKEDDIINLVEWIIYFKADSTETYDEHCQTIDDLIEQLYLNGKKFNTIQNNHDKKLCNDCDETYQLNAAGRNAIPLVIQDQTTRL